MCQLLLSATMWLSLATMCMLMASTLCRHAAHSPYLPCCYVAFTAVWLFHAAMRLLLHFAAMRLLLGFILPPCGYFCQCASTCCHAASFFTVPFLTAMQLFAAMRLFHLISSPPCRRLLHSPCGYCCRRSVFLASWHTSNHQPGSRHARAIGKKYR